MEGIERRSESPSTRASSRLSNLSNQEVAGDSDFKDPKSKKKSSSSKRKTRNNDKENGDVGPGTNGDILVTSDDVTVLSQSGDKMEMGEVNVVNDSEVEQNGEENGEVVDVTTDEMSLPEEDRKESSDDVVVEVDEMSVNGDVQEDGENGKESGDEAKEAESAKEVGNDSAVMDAEESYFTPCTESTPGDRTESGEASPREITAQVEENGNGEAETERQNGFENGDADEASEGNVPRFVVEEAAKPEQKTEQRAGFFGKWKFGLTAEKKEPEANGQTEEYPVGGLYYSSIKGRNPLRNMSPSVALGENGDSVAYRRQLATPNNTRTLNDSFGVKSEPSRYNRDESKDRPNLRKFPAKRCLNADESDEREDSLMSNVVFNKRRKLDEKQRTGFLRSFLWSPFRKSRISASEDVAPEGTSDRSPTAKSSWFRSPFWFWRRCSREEEGN